MTQLRVVDGDAGMCQLIVSWMAISVKTSSQISDSVSITVEANVHFLEGDKPHSVPTALRSLRKSGGEGQ